VATQPCHLYSLLAFLDPLLGLAALVIEVDDLPVRKLCVGYDEAQPGEQFPGISTLATTRRAVVQLAAR
jgi:hypothetical protein